MLVRLKKTIFTSLILSLLVFSGCSGIGPNNDSDAEAVTNVKLSSDYSKISVTWNADEDFYGFYDVYISKDDDVNNAQLTSSGLKSSYNFKDFTVEEPGHYYVWVRTGFNGPFSECKEVDVSFINPGSITNVETSIFGVKIEFQKPEDAGEYVKFAYKKTDETDWNYTSEKKLSGTHRINLNDGTYVFKLLVSDEYKTYVPSEETETITYSFDSTKYGKEPSCPAYVEEGYVVREFTPSATEECYYIQCEKGEYVEFDVLDNWSFDYKRLYGGYENITKLNRSDFVDLRIAVYISGVDIDKLSDYEYEGRVCSKEPSADKVYFTCPRSGCYVIRLSRISTVANKYGLTRIK